MKKQVKKGMSLFLSVLMLLSCWVWVAPNKAEAATAGNYPVTFYANVSDVANNCNNNVVIDYITNNGTGSSVSQTYSLDNLINNGTGNGKSYTVNVPGYPTAFRFSISRKSGANAINVRFYRMDIGSITVADETSGAGYTINTALWWDPRNWTVSPSSGGYSDRWTQPAVTTFSINNPSVSSVDINQWGGANKTASVSVNTVKDQYGVNWYQDPTWKIGTGESTFNGYTGVTNGAGSSAASSTTLTISPDAQTANKSTTNKSKTLYVQAACGGKTAVKSITLNNPSYTYTYYSQRPINPATGAQYSSATMYKNGSGTATNSYTESKYYYFNPSQYPTNIKLYDNGQEVKGYKFLGMYSNDNSNRTYDANQPSSSSLSGTRLGSSINTAENYNSTTRVITPPLTYYAAWWAQNVEAVFETEDHQQIGSYTAKFDQKANYNNAANLNNIQQKFNDMGLDTIQDKTFTRRFVGWGVRTAYDIDGNQLQNVSNGTSINDYVLKGKTVFYPIYEVESTNEYTVKFNDANGTEITSTKYHYRDDAERPADQQFAADNTYTYDFIGWAVQPDSSTNVYKVDANSYDSDKGTYVTTVSDFTVRRNITYIPVFEKKYINYTATFIEEDLAGQAVGSGKTVISNLHFGDTVNVPTPKDNFVKNGLRYTFTGWKVTAGTELTAENLCQGNVTYEAQYTTAPVMYVVRFFDHDGTQIETAQTEYAPNSTIEVPADRPVYRDELNEYTFTGWETVDGKALSTVATDDVDYYAQYDAKQLYTINYYNGDELLATIKEVAGTSLENKYTGVEPTKADDKFATNYKFKGWADVDGKTVATVGESNLDLYAQFDGDVTKYTVEFRNDDGTVISTQELGYQDKVVVPENPTKEADETFTYEFRGWDKIVSEVCEDSVVYTATYRRTYNYYKATWLDEDGNPIGTPQNYIYNERINPPIAPNSTKPAEDENHEWAFDSWVKVVDGVVTTDKFTRGERITGDVVYQATYKSVGKVCTVKIYSEDGTTLESELKVAYGTNLNDVIIAPIKASDSDHHWNFVAWLDMVNGGEVETVLDNIEIKPSYKAELHKFEKGEKVLIEAPTFDKAGLEERICDVCQMHFQQPIPALPDTVAPTSKLYVGNNKWESDGEAPNFNKKIPVSPSNIFIINTDDKADVNEYNKDGIGSGVNEIYFAITNGKYDDPSNINSWVPCYDRSELDDSRKDAEANVTAKLRDILNDRDLKNGDTFVIYAMVVDAKNGNVSYVSSGLLGYDDEAPVVNVTSDHGADKKFCLNATIEVEDTTDLKSLTLNGKKLELDENNTATVSEAGTYKVIAIDKAGNETVVNFEIVGKHDFKPNSKKASCEEPGYDHYVCTLCGLKDEDNSVDYPALGHDYGAEEEWTKIPASCTSNEKIIKRCKRCGKIETKVIEDTQLEHDYQPNEALSKAPTCDEPGVKVTECIYCHDLKEESVAIDPNAHEFYRDRLTTPPTCTEPGVFTHTCKYCGKVFDVSADHQDEIQPLGHDEGEWRVSKAATCQANGEEQLVCTRCDEVLDTRVIPMLADHVWEVISETEPTEDSPRTVTRKCKLCGKTETIEIGEKLERHTFTFVDEAGKEIAVLSKLKGETIVSTDVKEPTKKSDDTYNYKFAGWVDENGKVVEFPFNVADKDVTLTAKFNKTFISYSVTLYYENGTTQYKKIGYLHNETDPAFVLPENGPDKESDSTYDYKFDGWVDMGTGVKVTEIAKFDRDLQFKASYKKENRKYFVTFAYDADNLIKVYRDVLAGTNGNDLAAELAKEMTPVKAPDANVHYVFSGWRDLRPGALANIQADTLVYATFTTAEHNFDNGVIIQEQEFVCKNPEITRFTCKDCGYSEERITKEQGEHVWGDPVDGKRPCLNGCGESIDDETTYKVEFLNWDGSIIKTIDFLKYGEDISARIPTPTRPSTADTEYIFDGWTPDLVTTVTGNATYTAKYIAQERRYTVIFAYNSKNVIATFKDQPMMDDFSVLYTGEDPEPILESDNYGHYKFIGWSNRGFNEELKSIYFEAQFQKVDHTFTTKHTEASCEVGAGTTYTCIICGHVHTDEESAPLGHDWKIIERVEPTYGADGYIKRECARCHKVEIQTLPQMKFITITFNVTDVDGYPIENAKVTLFEQETGTFIASSTTDVNGNVKLNVPEAKPYNVTIEAPGVEQFMSTIVVRKDGDKVEVDRGWVDATGQSQIKLLFCDCTCHKDGVWPKIFRFFHKIIKMITGKYQCCNNPDPKYN